MRSTARAAAPLVLPLAAPGTAAIAVGIREEVGPWGERFGDAALADALLAPPSEAIAVSDPSIAAWYAVVEGDVLPFDAEARRELGGTVPVDDARRIIAARVSDQAGAAAEPGGAMLVLGAGGSAGG